jgi:hypothetical protein
MLGGPSRLRKTAEATSEAQKDVSPRFGAPQGIDERFAANQFFRSLPGLLTGPSLGLECPQRTKGERPRSSG